MFYFYFERLNFYLWLYEYIYFMYIIFICSILKFFVWKIKYFKENNRRVIRILGI